jgi:polyhydroxyalkanoate synthesis regulator protein
MKTIKRYANGQFYDPENKRYVKRSELVNWIHEKRDFKVLQGKTTQDVTQAVVDDLNPRDNSLNRRRFTVDPLKRLFATGNDRLRAVIARRIDNLMASLHLATREQIAELRRQVKKLEEMARELESLQKHRRTAAAEAKSNRSPATDTRTRAAA